MFSLLTDTIRSLIPPALRKVFFPSLRSNRRLLLWYANRLVDQGSMLEFRERLESMDRLRRKGKSFTFICNHLTYADSHIIETMLIRNGFRGLADHLIHIAGQKTFEIWRYAMTRSLNTIRVYQPKARIDKMFSRKMNAKALRWAGHLKRRGYSLLVFPEGTRSRSERRFNLLNANPRTTIYFRESFVIPLALMGPENILPVGHVLPKRAAVRLRIGEPIDYVEREKDFKRANPDKTEKEMRQSLMLEFMEDINQLLDPEYQFVQPASQPSASG